MNWPVFRSTRMNGLEPTMFCSFAKDLTAVESIFDQTCWGRIGTVRWDMIGVGALVTITTVVSLGAVAETMFAT
jgi:hypothetical protein